MSSCNHSTHGCVIPNIMTIVVHQTLVDHHDLSYSCLKEYTNSKKYQWIQDQQISTRILSSIRYYDHLVDVLVTAEMSEQQAIEFQLRFTE